MRRRRLRVFRRHPARIPPFQLDDRAGRRTVRRTVLPVWTRCVDPDQNVGVTLKQSTHEDDGLVRLRKTHTWRRTRQVIRSSSGPHLGSKKRRDFAVLTVHDGRTLYHGVSVNATEVGVDRDDHICPRELPIARDGEREGSHSRGWIRRRGLRSLALSHHRRGDQPTQQHRAPPRLRDGLLVERPVPNALRIPFIPSFFM